MRLSGVDSPVTEICIDALQKPYQILPIVPVPLPGGVGPAHLADPDGRDVVVEQEGPVLLHLQREARVGAAREGVHVAPAAPGEDVDRVDDAVGDLEGDGLCARAGAVVCARDAFDEHEPVRIHLVEAIGAARGGLGPLRPGGCAPEAARLVAEVAAYDARVVF